MRDVLILTFLAGALLMTVRYPFAGLLVWGWFTLATPHQAAYVAGSLPLNLMIAAITLVSFYFHGEFGRLKMTGLAWLILAFTIWLGVSQAFSLWPENSAEFTDRFVKVMVFILLCTTATTSRLRFHALLWTFASVMGFYALKGGAYTILTLGSHRYEGIDGTVLFDNNHMGIALATSVPVFLYLAQQVRGPLVRLALYGVALSAVIAVVGTQSRGALVALAALGGWTWLRSSRKIVTGLLGAACLLAALPFLPEHWTERMATISEAAEDESFMGRVDAWVINTQLAKENPLTGAGLRNPYVKDIAVTVSDREPRAAHSIYFEILGGTGFVGLALYLAMLAYGLLTAMLAERRYAAEPGGRWRARFGRHAQASLIVFGVGGASVSLEMWEGYLLLLALVGALARVDIAATTERPGFEIARIRRRAEIAQARVRIKARVPKARRPIEV